MNGFIRINKFMKVDANFAHLVSVPNWHHIKCIVFTCFLLLCISALEILFYYVVQKQFECLFLAFVHLLLPVSPHLPAFVSVSPCFSLHLSEMDHAHFALPCFAASLLQLDEVFLFDQPSARVCTCALGAL